MGRKDSSGLSSAEPQPAERGFGLRALVPGLRAIRADDRSFVALAGEQDDVARPRTLEGRFDRGAPIRR